MQGKFDDRGRKEEMLSQKHMNKSTEVYLIFRIKPTNVIIVYDSVTFIEPML